MCGQEFPEGGDNADGPGHPARGSHCHAPGNVPGAGNARDADHHARGRCDPSGSSGANDHALGRCGQCNAVNFSLAGSRSVPRRPADDATRRPGDGAGRSHAHDDL